jgi:hypothetical protein
MPYEDYLPAIVPPWLQAFWGGHYFKAVGRAMDGVTEAMRAAGNLKFPTQAPSDALPYVARERGLPRGPSETETAHRSRLENAWNLWPPDDTPGAGVGGGGGSHLGMLKELVIAGMPRGIHGTTIIQHNGRYAQLDSSGALVIGAGPVCIHRHDLTGAVPGDLVGFTLDARDQFYSKFALFFPADVPSLRAGTAAAVRVNDVVNRWKPAGSIYVGAFVVTAGAAWDWPTTQTWDDGTTWDSDTFYFVPPS